MTRKFSSHEWRLWVLLLSWALSGTAVSCVLVASPNLTSSHVSLVL